MLTYSKSNRSKRNLKKKRKAEVQRLLLGIPKPTIESGPDQFLRQEKIERHIRVESTRVSKKRRLSEEEQVKRDQTNTASGNQKVVRGCIPLV